MGSVGIDQIREIVRAGFDLILLLEVGQIVPDHILEIAFDGLYDYHVVEFHQVWPCPVDEFCCYQMGSGSVVDSVQIDCGPDT
jgi:hypothetical protein